MLQNKELFCINAVQEFLNMAGLLILL